NHADQTEAQELLLAALGMALRDWTRADDVTVFLEKDGRESAAKGLDVSRTVGWFHSLFPVVLSAARSGDPGEQIKQVKEMLRAIPHQGSGYSILKQLTDLRHKHPDDFTLQPKIVVHAWEQLDAGLETDWLTLSHLPQGSVRGANAERTQQLDVFAKVGSGELTIHIQYHRDEYRKATIDKLLELYRAHLNALLAHCLQKTETELTPSDFVDKNLSRSELDDIMDLISDL
ncbi:non-ribosomal peptide synthetase, partial [Mesorhizobium sp. M00.F.Ca.ET.186.01.1.1]